MIDFISGKVVEKNPTSVVLENNGLGYHLNISVETFEGLPAEGESVSLKTYLHVREDNLQLFAFKTNRERIVFTGLIGVSGIGPRLAQTVLSGLRLEELIAAIQSGSVDRLTSISGVGRKTAQRLIIELREKFVQLGLIDEPGDDGDLKLQLNTLEEEAMLALISLGYKKPVVIKALASVRRKERSGATVEALIKEALHEI